MFTGFFTHNRRFHRQYTFYTEFIGVKSCAKGRFKKTYEFLNLRALKISALYKNRTFQSMGKIFCVEFQREPLKFHKNILPTH